MIKYITVMSILLLCVGCTTPVQHFIINTAPAQTSHHSALKNIAFTVTDTRERQAILRTTNLGEHSYMGSQVPTTTFVDQGIKAQFHNQWRIGHSANASARLWIDIEKMGLKVEQKPLSYQTKSLIVFNVKLTDGTTTINKTFSRQGTSKGPLKADIAVLEQQFNLLLLDIYHDISHDEQIRQLLTI